jgi:hypothetical protein
MRGDVREGGLDARNPVGLNLRPCENQELIFKIHLFMPVDVHVSTIILWFQYKTLLYEHDRVLTSANRIIFVAV